MHYVITDEYAPGNLKKRKIEQLCSKIEMP